MFLIDIGVFRFMIHDNNKCTTITGTKIFLLVQRKMSVMEMHGLGYRNQNNYSTFVPHCIS